MLRIVVDLGNSRVKWGRLGLSGDLDASVALPTDGPSADCNIPASTACSLSSTP